METVRVVRDDETDAQPGKPRARSGVSFPYWDLDSAVEVAKTMHERAGGECDNDQLASLLGYSGVRNGSFRTRVSSAKMFGLIEDTDDQRLRVSPRGRAIVAPVTPVDGRNARVQAFLSVDLFKKVYERYRGTTLPENVGLRNLLQQPDFQVVPDRIAPTVRILLDSAEQAGLFETGGRTRMILPVGAAPPSQTSAPPTPAPAAPPSAPDTRHHVGGPGGGGTGGGGAGNGTNSTIDESGIDPAIVGLLRRLPPGGTPMSAKRRKALIDAFTNVVGFIYPDADDIDA